MSIYTIDLQTFKQDCKVSKTDKLEYGEIYTPFAFIKQMLDLFDPAVFQDPSKTWLDVGAGQGYFSMLLFSLLNVGLAFIIKEETARKTHIVQKMLFMVELKEPSDKAIRINITVPERVLQLIDAAVAPMGGNRSAFMVSAAEEKARMLTQHSEEQLTAWAKAHLAAPQSLRAESPVAAYKVMRTPGRRSAARRVGNKR